MEIFISWSRTNSKAAAEILRDWLPKVIQALTPWLSAHDIDKGTQWLPAITTRLKHASAGIVCLTPSNLHDDWILFEAGALSNTVKSSNVCTLLLGLKPSDLSFPLAQFQHTSTIKEDVFQMMLSLNKLLGESALNEALLSSVFEKWWPDLDLALGKIPISEEVAVPERTEADILDEILAISRSLVRPLAVNSLGGDYQGAVHGRVIEALACEGIPYTSTLCGYTADGSVEVEVELVETGAHRFVFPAEISSGAVERTILEMVRKLKSLAEKTKASRVRKAPKVRES